MRGLKTVGIIAAILFVAVALTFVAARFHDGPLAIIPGGPLVAGVLVSAPVTDWSFAADVETIELQLEGGSSSRTTWILVRDGIAFIPCSLGFPPGKSWHLAADNDGRAIVRVEGKRYPVVLTRIESPPLEANLKKIVSEKYGGGRRAPPASGSSPSNRGAPEIPGPVDEPERDADAADRDHSPSEVGDEERGSC